LLSSIKGRGENKEYKGKGTGLNKKSQKRKIERV